jgi:hypothetical protein
VSNSEAAQNPLETTPEEQDQRLLVALIVDQIVDGTLHNARDNAREDANDDGSLKVLGWDDEQGIVQEKLEEIRDGAYTVEDWVDQTFDTRQLQEEARRRLKYAEPEHDWLDDHRMEGTDGIAELFEQMRKMDMAAIGRALIGAIGEAQHNSWDCCPRSVLLAWDMVCRDLLPDMKATAEEKLDHDWGFGGAEYWDAAGVRHTEDEPAPEPNTYPDGMPKWNFDNAVNYVIDSYDLPADREEPVRTAMMELLRKENPEAGL